jgi:hypothetical protein
MSLERMDELARRALEESGRNDCQLVSVTNTVGAANTWSIDFLDVMQRQEPFRVTLSAAPASTEEEIKEAIRRGIAEHFSAAGY